MNSALELIINLLYNNFAKTQGKYKYKKSLVKFLPM